jgi:hypothetical protein
MSETSPRMALQPQVSGKGGDAKGSPAADRYNQRGLPVERASLTRLQESVKVLLTSVISGRSSGVSLAKLSPDGSWLKMYQDCFQATLDGSLEKFSLTWPKWGTLLAGVLSAQSMWEPYTEETESLLWPTPQTLEIESDCQLTESNRRLTLDGEDSHSLNLGRVVKMWPTPQSRDWKGAEGEYWENGAKDLPAAIGGKAASGGQLNPEWVTWLMGFPPGWLNLTSQESEQEKKNESINLKDSETP